MGRLLLLFRILELLLKTLLCACKEIFAFFNPIKPSVSYLIHTFLRPLNDQHDQQFSEQPVVHNLLRAFCHLIQSPLRIVIKNFTFRLWYTCFSCKIFTDFL